MSPYDSYGYVRAHRTNGGGPETVKNFTDSRPQTDEMHAILGKIRCALNHELPPPQLI